ncbi:uncharacterized protein LOC144937289 [Lampetra fluviatilis]
MSFRPKPRPRVHRPRLSCCRPPRAECLWGPRAIALARHQQQQLLLRLLVLQNHQQQQPSLLLREVVVAPGGGDVERLGAAGSEDRHGSGQHAARGWDDTPQTAGSRQRWQQQCRVAHEVQGRGAGHPQGGSGQRQQRGRHWRGWLRPAAEEETVEDSEIVRALRQRCVELAGAVDAERQRRGRDGGRHEDERHHLGCELQRLRAELHDTRERHSRLQNGFDAIGRVKCDLEEKICRTVKEFDEERGTLLSRVSVLTGRLAEAERMIATLAEDNKRCREDCRLAVQLLQCSSGRFACAADSQLFPETSERPVPSNEGSLTPSGYHHAASSIATAAVASPPPHADSHGDPAAAATAVPSHLAAWPGRLDGEPFRGLAPRAEACSEPELCSRHELPHDAVLRQASEDGTPGASWDGAAPPEPQRERWNGRACRGRARPFLARRSSREAEGFSSSSSSSFSMAAVAGAPFFEEYGDVASSPGEIFDEEDEEVRELPGATAARWRTVPDSRGPAVGAWRRKESLRKAQEYGNILN